MCILCNHVPSFSLWICVGDRYHAVSTLHMDDALIGGSGGIGGPGLAGMDESSRGSLSNPPASTGGGGAGAGGSNNTSPLAMAWLASSIGIDNASAVHLDYPRLSDAGNATVLQVSE